MTAEGLLFTALGFALRSEDEKLKCVMVPMVACVGIVIGFSAALVLDSANAAITRWSVIAKEDGDSTSQSDDDGSVEFEEVIGYRAFPLISLLSPWRVFPPLFIVAWYIISSNLTQ